MKKRLMILTLLLSLLLTACDGRQGGGSQDSVSKEASAENEDALLLTVDGREVPLWRYRYWLVYVCAELQAQYEAAGLSLKWDAPVGDGTLADYAKERALADTVLYATVENWAERYGCSPQDVPEETPLPALGFRTEQLQELQAVGQKYAALWVLACREGSLLAPSREQLAAYAEEQGILTLDRILIAGGEDRQRARERAEELFSRLNGAENQAAEFAALAAEGDDARGPRTLQGDGWDEGLLDAARALQPGQCSGILESPEGFSILLRLETDLAGLEESYFDAQLQQAAEQAKVLLQPEYEMLQPEAWLP